MELTGTWQAAAADEFLRRSFHARGFDDGDWLEVEVPGHWADHQDLSSASSVLHRRRFGGVPELDEGERRWLELDGVFSQGDVWLDGNYLGDTEGYFVRHAFDVTDVMDPASDHELAIEVSCNRAGASGKRRSILGIYEGGNDIFPGASPVGLGGIWAPIRLRKTGPVRIDRLRAVCATADERSARVAIRAVLISTGRRTVVVRTTIGGQDHRFEQSLAEGSNQVEWQVDVPSPSLWWPRALGDQPMYELAVVVESRHDDVSDTAARRIGLRRATMRNWKLSVNGEPLFLKGVNLAPARALPAHTSDADIERQLDLVLHAGLDLVRPYAHVATDRFYERADDLGLMVWQDLPLRGHAANSLRREATRQASAMVDQLGQHPSIFTWNAHVSPADEWMTGGPTTVRQIAGRVAGHQLPTWSKSVLDRSIKSAIEHGDGTRHVSGFSGVLPHLPRLDGTATHLWFGWRRGSERDLPTFAARWPSQVRFVAEMGAQSIPDAPILDCAGWPDLDPDQLAELGYEASGFERYVPRDGHDDLDSWRAASQHYQAGLVRRQVEALRRLKYRPTGGFCVHHLIEVVPAVGFGLVDHLGQEKPAYSALREACRPVIVVADRLPATIRHGEPHAIDIHVVNDRHVPLREATVDAHLQWPGGEHHWRFAGDVDADAVTKVGMLSWVVPEAVGLATLHISLVGTLGTDEVEAANRYDALIRPPRR